MSRKIKTKIANIRIGKSPTPKVIQCNSNDASVLESLLMHHTNIKNMCISYIKDS